MAENEVLSQNEDDSLMIKEIPDPEEWDESTGQNTPAPGESSPEVSDNSVPLSLKDLEDKSLVEHAQAHSLDFILDIPLEVSVELGRTKMLINDLLQLGQGSVIELTKLAGEPLEILVNSKLVARGEVVVINEKFGVRLTDIVSPLERVKSLG